MKGQQHMTFEDDNSKARTNMREQQHAVLNAKIKELESSIAVLQSEKDEVDVRCSAVTDENEGLSGKMMKLEEERRNVVNEKESFGTRIVESEISMEGVKGSNEDICKGSDLLSSGNEVPTR